MLNSRELTGTPNTPVEIVVPPQYGTAVLTQNNTALVYTSEIEDSTSTILDTVTYQYTNLSGKVVLDRRDFLVKQSGDVPRIIQTGENDLLATGTSIAALLLAAIFAIYISRRLSTRRENE